MVLIFISLAFREGRGGHSETPEKCRIGQNRLGCVCETRLKQQMVARSHINLLNPFPRVATHQRYIQFWTSAEHLRRAVTGLGCKNSQVEATR